MKKKKEEADVKNISLADLTKNAIEVMNAFSEGKEIEGRRRGDENAEWETVVIPSWDWYNCEFRVKPFTINARPEGLVGGRIFFVDGESDEEVEFYDKEGRLIPEVKAGDMPYRYRITKKGSKPKYWVYHHKFSKWLQWRPDEDKYRVLIGTSEEFLTGAENTKKALDAFPANAEGFKDTIWAYILVMRSEKWGGCDDWFVPSKGELDVLRKFFQSETANELGLVNPFDITWLWSSAEYSAQYAWFWNCNGQYWYNSYKLSNYSVCGVRAL